MRVLSIGIDGGDPVLINKWLDKLPNFKKIKERGVFGICWSTKPAISGPAWVSYATGRNPGNTGIVAFIQRIKNSYRTATVNATDVKEKAFWQVAGEFGLKVVVINVPITYPAKEVNGVLVPGFPSPLNYKTYPADLAKELEAEDYKVDIEIDLDDDFEEIKKKLVKLVKKRLKVALRLFKKNNPDLGIIVFTAPDRIQDLFYADADKSKKVEQAILTVYQEVDKSLGKLLDYNKDGLTFINSDHGACKVKRQFNLNDWLIQNGFLKLKKNQTSFLAKVMISLDLTVGGFWFKVLAKLGLVERLRQLLPQWLVHKIPWENLPNFENLNVDWSKTIAYSYGNQNLIYLNKKGREPEGVVTKKREKIVREKIIKELKRLKDNDRQVSIKIWQKEELYKGRYLEQMPEVIFEIEGNSYCPVTSVGHASVFSDPGKRKGDHSPRGIFLSYGRGVKKQVSCSCQLKDLAPTMLFALGIKPVNMDGRILKEIFLKELELDKKFSRRKEISSNERKKLLKNIHQLKSAGKI